MRLFKRHEKKYLLEKQGKVLTIPDTGQVIVGYKDYPTAFYNRARDEVGNYLVEPKVEEAKEEFRGKYFIGCK